MGARNTSGHSQLPDIGFGTVRLQIIQGEYGRPVLGADIITLPIVLGRIMRYCEENL